MNNQNISVDLVSISEVMNSSINEILLGSFCIILIFISLKIAVSSSLLNNLVFFSIFSMTISCIYLFMDAPDVAMTEVALGTCLSTCVILNFLKNIAYTEKIIPIKLPLTSWKHIYSGILCLTLVFVMIYLKIELPIYGDANSPVQTGVSHYYLSNTLHQIGISSSVGAVLASYRGFDTLGETSVILIGGMGTLLILAKDNNSTNYDNQTEITLNNSVKHPILSYVTNFIFCFIILYSFYIQLNGEISPGGGFQAGVIFASGIISYDLIYGRMSKYFSDNTLLIIGVLGVLIYAIIGIVSFIANDNYLNYNSLSLNKIEGQYLGIFLVEISVGFTVASVMCLIYSLFQKTKSF